MKKEEIKKQLFKHENLEINLVDVSKNIQTVVIVMTQANGCDSTFYFDKGIFVLTFSQIIRELDQES